MALFTITDELCPMESLTFPYSYGISLLLHDAMKTMAINRNLLMAVLLVGFCLYKVFPPDGLFRAGKFWLYTLLLCLVQLSALLHLYMR